MIRWIFIFSFLVAAVNCQSGPDNVQEQQGFQLTFHATNDASSPVSTASITVRAFTQRLTTSTPIPFVCGNNITIKKEDFETNSSNVYFESPNYPETYPNNAECTWYITGPVGLGLGFTAETFDLEGVMCDKDWLSFTDVTEEPKCAFGEGVCPTAGDEEICFRADSFCDGKPDCPGGADEVCPPGCGIPFKKPLLSTRHSKVVGGIEAKLHTWPWQVSMLNPDGSHRCGASVIDHHWILTAAHCCEPANATYKIRVGEHDMNGSLEPNAWTYDLERVIMHPQFGYLPALHHDISLLKTVMDVYPVCLNFGTETPVGTNCFVTGWGATAQRNYTWPNETTQVSNHTNASDGDEKSSPTRSSRTSRPLLQVDLKITSHETCNAAYRGVLTEDVICAYNLGKDSCQGDSGGPLVCPSRWDPSTFEQVGVVSGGHGCGSEGIPGLYASTSYFLDWISETVMNN